MKIGVGYVQRETFVMVGHSHLPVDGHLDREFIHRRKSGTWLPIVSGGSPVCHHGTEQLLVSLAMEKIEECPFPPEDVAELKQELIDVAAGCGFLMQRKEGDRTDVPIDFKFLDLLLRAAGDPEAGLGEYA